MIAWFEKTLTNADIKLKLSVPTGFINAYGSYLVIDVPLLVTDGNNGDINKFVLSTRQGDHLKPVFQSRGWLPFVKKNALQIGDRILFSIEDDGQYRIRITGRNNMPA